RSQGRIVGYSEGRIRLRSQWGSQSRSHRTTRGHDPRPRDVGGRGGAAGAEGRKEAGMVGEMSDLEIHEVFRRHGIGGCEPGNLFHGTLIARRLRALERVVEAA